MNIKFEKIINRTFEQIKNRWSSMLLNALIMFLVTFAIAFAGTLALVMIISIAVGFITSGELFAVGIALAIVGAILGIIFMIILTFWVMISGYVLADASMDDTQAFFNSVKKSWNKVNFKFACISVFLPTFGVTILFYIFLLIAFLINPAFGIVLAVILAIPYAAATVYIQSYFVMSLYTDVDTIAAREKLSVFSRKQIFFAYLVSALINYLFSFVLGAVSFVPIIGFIISLLFSTLISTGVAQAMILEINEQLNGSKETGNANQNVSFSSGFAQIKSDSVVVTIKNSGAEITSVMKNGKEIMWQADPSYWGKTSPVLFPFVGRLKDDQFSAGGKTIQMSQHGFLRDRNFNLISQTENSATFEYTSNLADYEVYPCDFTVQITYRVFGSRVTTEYNVINNSNYPMPYQIGAHPGFNVESVNDLELVFPAQQVTKHYFENALQTKTEQVELSNIQLSHELIEENIPCFSDFKNKKLTLKQNGVDFLHFEFDSMEYLAVWSPEFKNAKFVCIEPWNGICSRTDQEGYLLENKDGMNILDANSSKVCSYSFEIC